MSETTDRAELIAELNFLPEFVLGTIRGLPLTLAGFTRERIAKALTAAATALARSERDLAKARADTARWKATWRRSDESGEKHANGFLEERCSETERADTAEQRERVLLAGVREALTFLDDNDNYSQSGLTEFTPLMSILSGLLPSTTNEKGNDDE